MLGTQHHPAINSVNGRTRIPRFSPDGRQALLRPLLEGAIGVPFTEGNRIDVLRNGIKIFPAMLEAIRNAKSTLDS